MLRSVVPLSCTCWPDVSVFLRSPTVHLSYPLAAFSSTTPGTDWENASILQLKQPPFTQCRHRLFENISLLIFVSWAVLELGQPPICSTSPSTISSPRLECSAASLLHQPLRWCIFNLSLRQPVWALPCLRNPSSPRCVITRINPPSKLRR